jgi:hypothetical protein
VRFKGKIFAMSVPAVAQQYIPTTASHHKKRLPARTALPGGFCFPFERLLPPELQREVIRVANHWTVTDIVTIMSAFSHHLVRFVLKFDRRGDFPEALAALRYPTYARKNQRGYFSGASIPANVARYMI